VTDLAPTVVLVALAAAVLLGILWRATSPPRCPRCGRAGEVDGEEQLVTSPPVFEVDFRCPGCGGLVARRRIGMPHE
jgi:hypothetical protein